MKAWIAQTPPAISPPQTPSDFTAWGILGAIVWLVGREAVSVFRQQNNQEAKLLQQLLTRQQEREDRMDQRHEAMLARLEAVVTKTHDGTVRLQTALDELIKLQYQQGRVNAENIMGIRKEVADLRSGVAELLRRSDQDRAKPTFLMNGQRTNDPAKAPH